MPPSTPSYSRLVWRHVNDTHWAADVDISTHWHVGRGHDAWFVRLYRNGRLIEFMHDNRGLILKHDFESYTAAMAFAEECVVPKLITAWDQLDAV